MTALTRVSIIVVWVIVFGLFLLSKKPQPSCPQGQVPVLGADRWYCVVGTPAED